jgi:hypothetical protein
MAETDRVLIFGGICLICGGVLSMLADHRHFLDLGWAAVPLVVGSLAIYNGWRGWIRPRFHSDLEWLDRRESPPDDQRSPEGQETKDDNTAL